MYTRTETVCKITGFRVSRTTKNILGTWGKTYPKMFISYSNAKSSRFQIVNKREYQSGRKEKQRDDEKIIDEYEIVPFQIRNYEPWGNFLKSHLIKQSIIIFW